MIIHDLGEIDYIDGRNIMSKIHEKAIKDEQNHLILCTHPNTFTVGSDDENDWPVDVVKCDRGGSITCHSRGQNIYYFCFQVPSAMQFYRRIVKSFESFFADTLPVVTYDRLQPGFYLNSKKIASLGFRYSKGVSLHGVSLNVDVDLDFHNQVAPCNLKGITATSLIEEGVQISQDEVNKRVIKAILTSFDESL